MRRLMAGLMVLVVFGMCVSSYGALNMGHRVLVYRGTMKAAKTIFAEDDTNDLLSGSIPIYLAVDVCDATGVALGADSVIYAKRDKIYQLYPGGVTISPSDPNHVVLLSYAPAGDTAVFNTVRIGKLRKIYEPNRADANTAAKFPVPIYLKGAGTVDDFNALGTRISGSLTIALKLDSRLTKQANSDGNNVDDVIDAVVERLTRKGGWEQVPTPD